MPVSATGRGLWPVCYFCVVFLGKEPVAVPADSASGGQGALCGRACSLDGVRRAQGVHRPLVAVVHEACPLWAFTA